MFVAFCSAKGIPFAERKATLSQGMIVMKAIFGMLVILWAHTALSADMYLVRIERQAVENGVASNDALEVNAEPGKPFRVGT